MSVNFEREYEQVVRWLIQKGANLGAARNAADRIITHTFKREPYSVGIDTETGEVQVKQIRPDLPGRFDSLLEED